MLTFALVASACAMVDSGTNPPPRRVIAAAVLPTPAAEQRVADEASLAVGPSAAVAPAHHATAFVGSEPSAATGTVTPVGEPADPAVPAASADPAVPAASADPAVPAAGPASPTAPDAATEPVAARSTGRAATTLDLLVSLDESRISSPLLMADPDLEVLPEGKRSFANPWVSAGRGRFDRRVVWTDGARHEWALRSALVLPVPATVEWSVDVPPSGRLELDAAVGARVSELGPVVLTVRVDGEVAYSGEQVPAPIQKLKAWTPVVVELTRWAGKKVTLSLGASSTDARRGYRYTAFFARPRITSTAPEAARAATGLEKPPNVLLLVVDAQRGDTVGEARRQRARLPALFPVMETFLGEGVQLTQAFAVGNQTRLSTYAFLAGQYPTYGGWHLGKWNYPPEVKRGYYERNPPLIAHLLRERGYVTGAVANNLFLFGNMEVSVDVGFGELHDHRHGTEDTEWITQSTLAWLDRNRDHRWFLMVNYNGPHTPYLPPRAAVDAIAPQLAGVQGYATPYLAEIKATDEHIARLLEHLERLGLADDTIVVLTADHGEVMDARHQCYAENWDSNCLHNHGKTLFDEETHVPLAFRWPGHLAPGGVLTTAGSHIDLVPTLLGLIGAPGDPRLLGRDLSPELIGAKEPAEVPLLCEARLASAVRWKGLKYVVHDPREKIDFDSKSVYDRRRGKEELYDLVRDPDELQNLAYGDAPCGGPGSARPDGATCDELLVEYRAKYKAIRQELQQRRGTFAVSSAPETLAGDDTPPPAAVDPAAPAGVPGTQTGAPGAAGAVPGTPVGASAPATAGTHGSAEPDTAAASSAPRSASLTWLHLRLHGPGAFAGTIRGDAPIAAAEVVGEATPGTQLTLNDGVVTLSAAGGVELRLRVSADSGVELALSRDGVTLGRSETYAGAYGLCLLGATQGQAAGVHISPDDLAWLESPVAPHSSDAIAPGLFVWADAGAAGQRIQAERAEDLDEEVRDMMKEWGYAGK